MLALPNFAWADKFDNSNLSQKFDNDIEFYFGAVPVLAYSFGNQSTFGVLARRTIQRLKIRGIRDLVLRLMHPYGAPLPEPERFPDVFGGDLDMLMSEGVYPTVFPWNEEVEHGMYTYPQLAERYDRTREVLTARWPLWVIPMPFAQDRVRTPECVQAFDAIYRRDKVINWHYYAVTRADLEDDAPFTPEWIAEQYPDCQILVTEWGMLHDPSNPESPVWTDEERIDWLFRFGRRFIGHPQISKAFYFLPDGTADQGQHLLNTEAKKNAMRILCDEWRQMRTWARWSGKVIIGPPVPAPDPATGGEIAAQFPELWNQWIAAGGARNNFLKHVLGLGLLTPTKEDLLLLARENLASASQVAKAVAEYPFVSSRSSPTARG